MMKHRKYGDINVEEFTWHEVRNDVKTANPILANLIDRFEPSNKYTFLKVRYLFGDRILNQGLTHLPLKSGGTVPLMHSKVPEVLREKLGHRMVPMGLLLSKSIEVFYETDERVMPSKLFGAGSLIGLWEAFDPPPTEFLRSIWNLSAGARSICMLPSISETGSHAKLRRDFGVTAYPPKTLLNHSNVFVELCRGAAECNNWFCDVLFFTDKWLENPKDNLGFLQLHHYWLQEAWKQSINGRNQMSYDVAWEVFSREVTRRNWKPRAHVINIIKHLLSIGEGIFPGFIPATDETAAPIKFLQDCYINSYQLKDYAPIIIVPHHLRELTTPVYYSLSLPTQLEHAPKAKNSPTIIGDIRELKMLMNVLINSMSDSHHHYDFFHCEEDQFGEIQHVSDMPITDPRLMMYPAEYGERRFPDNSAFLRGCIKISKIKENLIMPFMQNYA
jgi:hypothetical protein